MRAATHHTPASASGGARGSLGFHFLGLGARPGGSVNGTAASFANLGYGDLGGEVLALDAKMTFDDNALYRQKDVVALRDVHEEDASELEAQKWNLSYVKLDGNIGCMVNGAGLAMSTMDIIQYKGAEPANFLDVGGGATQEQVAAAFRIITADPAVTGILVNIFGGIMKCDVIANGVVAAAKDLGLTVPVAVRLAGTNVELGQQILRESGLDLIPASDMADGAQKIVDAVRQLGGE